MNPKTLQYLMGHSDIGVTMNVYTHLGLEEAADELKRIEALELARKEIEKQPQKTELLFRTVSVLLQPFDHIRLSGKLPSNHEEI